MGKAETGHRTIRLLVSVTAVSAAISSAAQTLPDREMALDNLTRNLPAENRDTSYMIFGGDFMLHRAQIENADRNGQYVFDGCLDPVRHIIGNADISAGNMEFTLGGKPYSGYPAFSSPESFPEYIRDCGIRIFMLANNHIMDRGARGAERTLSHYRSMGDIRFTGCGADSLEFQRTNPLFIRLSGIRVALINFTYGTNVPHGQDYPKVSLMDRKELHRLFSKARNEGAEIIIALPHWGTEYSLRASGHQKEMASWLVSEGASIIIGSHPHVVQETGRMASTRNRDSVSVIYSTGNLISNMSARNTRIGMLVRVGFTRDEEGRAIVLKPECTYTWCSLPGRLSDRHTVIPVAEYIGRREEWENPADYDIMMHTYERIRNNTGLKEIIPENEKDNHSGKY